MTKFSASAHFDAAVACPRWRERRLRALLVTLGALGMAALPLHAADVVVQPASGYGFVVKDAGGANDRFRVQESGAVNMPAVVSAPVQTQSLCIGAAGQLGPCNGVGNSYAAGTGLVLSGTTFSVAPTYQLPQGCSVNQFAQWNGSAWSCGNASGTALPAGTMNQTLRYDASNTLTANNLLQAFNDGGLLAGGTQGVGSIPATGSGMRMMWYPAKAAFRAGGVNSPAWDDANVGSFSIATGQNSIASGDTSISMGIGPVARGKYSVALGDRTTANGDDSTALGHQTLAGGLYAFAAGDSNVANGQSSVALGNYAKATGAGAVALGSLVTADGAGSIAMGTSASSNGHDNVFVYNDGFNPGFVPAQDRVFMATAMNGFTFSAGTSANPLTFTMVPGGGVTFVTGTSSGVHVAVGSGSWTSVSDRDAKTALHAVDPREVLEKVVSLSMNTWQYKSQDVKYRHMGPMAQDFYAAFHLGETDKGIDVVDADGVALAAIQGLDTLFKEKSAEIAAHLDEKDQEIAGLRAELAAQKSENAVRKSELAAQTVRIAALESMAGELASMKSQLVALQKPPSIEAAVALQQP